MTASAPTTSRPEPDISDRSSLTPKARTSAARYLPFLDWLVHYQREHLTGDVMAGVIVAIMLIPQSMAYAMLAGLPPQVGLYASILPVILYALLGSSRTLAVGPVAIMSLLTATSVGALATPGTPEYLTLALVLAFLVGVIQVVMGLARIGFLANFLSHPVISGFTSAAALIIGGSQLKHLLGLSIPSTNYLHETLIEIGRAIGQTNPVSAAIGLGSIALLSYFKRSLFRHLRSLGVQASLAGPITKAGPLLVVLIGTVLVWGFSWHETQNVAVVGSIPAGLPGLTVPSFELATWRALLPAAITISIIGFMESISVGQSLASRRRQNIDANQELIGLGAANLGAAFTGGYTVTGGFSRSVVNYTAGANTQLSSILTAGLIGLTVLVLTPLFYYLPQTVLAAIVLVAVAALIDVTTLRHVWSYNRADALSLLATFAAVLATGVETGILIGVAVAIALYLWRSSRPHVAVVGRVADSESYRNILRHDVSTCPHVVAIRVDESLYFANTRFLQSVILRTVAERPEVRHLVLVGSAINFIDASALETLGSLLHELREAGVTLYLADMKGPVMDRLKAIGFIDRLGRERVFLSTHDAMLALGCA